MDMILVPLALILCLSVNLVAAAPPMARTGCVDKCGNVTIPYPFGMGSSCYYNEWYEITCNSSILFLTKFNLQVLEISLGITEVMVNAPMIVNCSEEKATWTSTNLGGSPYSFSTGNVFAPVNCAATSFYNGLDKVLAYCGSTCDLNALPSLASLQEFICLTYLPFSLSVYSVNITRSKGICSYVFLADLDYLQQFDLSQPERSVLPIARNGSHILISLQWAYNYLPGSSENDSSPYCSDIINGDYKCHCPQGQGGNPYLRNGCQESPQCVSCKGDCIVCASDFNDVMCNPSKINRAHLLAVVLGLGVSIGLLFVSFGCYWLRRFLKRRKETKQRAKNFKLNGGLLLRQQMSYNDGVMEKTKVFTIKELEVATDHFHENRILGQGGQGTVYKGMLTNGRIIAVKKSKRVDESQLEPFINEVVILSQINHRNVVKLLGCCLETEVPLLVYEFIPNGTLSQHIHDPSDEFYISWKMRLQIAAESAGAITYLHSSSSTPIYHRDIKSSNILLDEKYRAKVSDFGTSRTITIDQTHLTTQVQGTFGYLDPDSRVFSIKPIYRQK